MTLRALGGGELDGEKLVKFVYLDAAGLSHPKNEPEVVVAGVIVDTDQQWRPLEIHFKSLVEKYIPAEQRSGFIFHAMDIWHGAGVFNREKWIGDRREVLRDLVETVPKFQLPVVFGSANRSKAADIAREIANDSESNIKRGTNLAFMVSFMECVVQADRWMRKYAPSNEVAALVVEDDGHFNKYAKSVFNALRTNPQPSALEHLKNDLPLSKIIHAPHFMEKIDAPPLQLADVSAFLLKRFICGKRDTGEYVVKILPSMFDAVEKLKALVLSESSSQEQAM